MAVGRISVSPSGHHGELEGEAARLPDAALHRLGDLVQVRVARGQLGPGRRDPDDRPAVEDVGAVPLVAHPGAVDHPGPSVRAEPLLAASVHCSSSRRPRLLREGSVAPADPSPKEPPDARRSLPWPGRRGLGRRCSRRPGQRASRTDDRRPPVPSDRRAPHAPRCSRRCRARGRWRRAVAAGRRAYRRLGRGGHLRDGPARRGSTRARRPRTCTCGSTTRRAPRCSSSRCRGGSSATVR